MSEPIKLYRDGQTIETFSPSTAKAWQAIGWTLQPDAMPDEVQPAEPVISTEHWAGDMLTQIAPEPIQNPSRRTGRPKKTQ